ncbi:MAG: sugar transferase [Bacteroidota bacterium]
MFRLRDILIALLLLLTLSWLLLLIALLLAVTQKRVLFWQERTGFGGQPFRMVKFSTLRDIRPGEREEDDQQRRLTPVGRWLRRFSLDELPQLWLVLVGKMSLVGPRPLLHEYWPLYSDVQKRRFEVLPGITGLAQVRGRNLLTFTERFELDVAYVDGRTFGMDVRIMWETFVGVFRGRGVYADGKTTMEKFNGRN